MKTLNYNQLEPNQREQVKLLIANLEGQQENNLSSFRFVARGNGTNGEFRGEGI
jgi:hypothetical protein